MDVEKEKRKPHDFRALTGVTVEQFDAPPPYFSYEVEGWLEAFTWTGKPRTARHSQRETDGPLGSVPTMLLFVLFALKQNPSQVVLGRMFGVSREEANRRLGVLLPLFNRAVKRWEPSCETGYWRVEVPENQTLALDAAERQIERPKVGREEVCSGKKNFIR